MIDQLICDPTMHTLFIAFGSVISGTIAALKQRDSAKEANQTNLTNARNINELNRQQFEQSRGSEGHAILPWYLKDAQGNPFESSTLGPALTDAFNRTGGATPQDYQNLADRWKPAQAGADQSVNDIFSGENLKQRLSNFAPVAQARRNTVAYTREGAVTALNKTLNDIEATQAQKGFVGGGSATNQMRYNAGRDLAQTVATQTGNVNLANAGEEQGLRDQDINTRLQSLNLPYAQAQRAIDSFNLPNSAYLDFMARRLQPLSFLNIKTAAPFQYSPMPTINPLASNLGLIAQGGAGAGNAALDLYLKRLSARQYDRAPGGGGGGPPSSGTPGYGSDYGNEADYGGGVGGPGGTSEGAGAGSGEGGAASYSNDYNYDSSYLDGGG